MMILNMMDRLRQSNILKNIGINFIFKGISMLLSFIYVPIALAYMGDYRYGVWATISSIVMWIQLSDIGIGNGLRNKLTEALAHDNRQLAQGLVSTAYMTMLGICILLGIIYAIAAYNFDLASLCNIKIAGDNTNRALSISVAFVLINFWLGIVSQIFYALQKPAVLTVAGTAGQAVNVVFILIATYSWPVNLPLVAILLGILSLIIQLALTAYVFIKYDYLRPKPLLIERKYVRSIASIGILLFIGQINSVIVSSTDNILISKLFTPADVTPYATAYKFFQILIVLGGLIIMPMWSAFTLKKEQRKYDWMRRSLKKMNQITMAFSVGAIVLIFLIPPISDVWLQYHLEYDNKMLIIMAMYTIVYSFSCNYAAILCGVGKVKMYSLLAMLSAVLNIPLSVVLAVDCNLGVAGIMAGTVLTLMPSAVILPLETKKWFDSVTRL